MKDYADNKYTCQSLTNCGVTNPAWNVTDDKTIILDGYFYVSAEWSAVVRQSHVTGDRTEYVSGLGANEGTPEVAMSFDSATYEAYRLNALNDGCTYTVVDYIGGEE